MLSSTSSDCQKNLRIIFLLYFLEIHLSVMANSVVPESRASMPEENSPASSPPGSKSLLQTDTYQLIPIHHHHHLLRFFSWPYSLVINTDDGLRRDPPSQLYCLKVISFFLICNDSFMLQLLRRDSSHDIHPPPPLPNGPGGGITRACPELLICLTAGIHTIARTQTLWSLVSPSASAIQPTTIQ